MYLPSLDFYPESLLEHKDTGTSGQKHLCTGDLEHYRHHHSAIVVAYFHQVTQTTKGNVLSLQNTPYLLKCTEEDLHILFCHLHMSCTYSATDLIYLYSVQQCCHHKLDMNGCIVFHHHI